MTKLEIKIRKRLLIKRVRNLDQEYAGYSCGRQLAEHINPSLYMRRLPH